jgi:hypothetical protein
MLGNTRKGFGCIQNFRQQFFIQAFYGQKMLEFALLG